ncbi:MAG: murein biosynthesis integral membrane protein MurJ [Myxococcota bacterium]
MSAPGEPAAAPRPAPSVRAVALLLGASVALSRVVGYVREITLANQLGVGSSSDAYNAAFTIPDVLNYLLAGGALTVAFVPFYTRVRRERGDAAAQQLFETVLGTTAALVVVATCVLFALADELVRVAFSGFDAPTRALTARLSRILLPAQVFFVTGGIVRAVLMVEGRFATHAVAPVVYNLGIIAGGLATGTPEGFAWGALAGAVVGPFALPVADLLRTHRVGLRIDLRSRDFRTYAWIALPLMLGLSLTTVDEWYEKLFGQALAVGTVAVLGFARKLVQAPIAIVGQAIGVAALPTLTRLWSEGRTDELERVLSGALRAAIGLGALSAAFVFAFAAPVVTVLYQHGAFSAEAAARTGRVLAVMSFAIVGWIAQQVAVRAFYAREEMWRAMALGTAIVVAVVPLYVFAGGAYGAEGLAAAGAVAMVVNAVATLAWARARFGGPRLGPLARSLARSAVVAAAAAAAGRAAGGAAVGALGAEGRAAAIAELVAGGAAFAAAAAIGLAAVGDAETRATAQRLAGRAARLARRRR